MKFFSLYNMLNLALYGIFGYILAACGVGVLSNPLVFFALMGILVYIDCSSFKKGMERGGEITKEVWGIK